MKRELESPKIIIYENVKAITDILAAYDIDDPEGEEIAEEILKKFKINRGKARIIELFENNIQAVSENGKIALQLSK